MTPNNCLFQEIYQYVFSQNNLVSHEPIKHLICFIHLNYFLKYHIETMLEFLKPQLITLFCVFIRGCEYIVDGTHDLKVLLVSHSYDEQQNPSALTPMIIIFLLPPHMQT